jgi:hypothetical protein
LLRHLDFSSCSPAARASTRLNWADYFSVVRERKNLAPGERATALSAALLLLLAAAGVVIAIVISAL